MGLRIDDAIRRALLQRSIHRLACGVDVVDLHASVGHGYMMSLDGRVFEWELDETDREVTDPVGIRKALFTGARTIPELSRLIPSRPTDASECDTCGGGGYERLGNQIKWLCGACGGLGWNEGAG